MRNIPSKNSIGIRYAEKYLRANPGMTMASEFSSDKWAVTFQFGKLVASSTKCDFDMAVFEAMKFMRLGLNSENIRSETSTAI